MKTIQALILSLLCLNACHAETILKNIEGKAIPFSSLKGKWIFINYWASWCQPCKDEIPELNQFFKEHSTQNDVALFGVNYDQLPLAAQKQLIKAVGIQYPSLSNNPAKSLALEDINGVPVTFVFDPKGKLAATLYGPQTVHSLNQSMID